MQTKISELPAADHVNDGDLICIVQNGTTKKVNAEMVNAIIPGDVVTLSGSFQFGGVATSSTVLRFLIPFSKHIKASRVDITGSFAARGNGASSGYTAVPGQIYTQITSLGVLVEFTYSTSPSWLTNQQVYMIQPSNMVLTFS